jgi:hypothetical protein
MRWDETVGLLSYSVRERTTDRLPGGYFRRTRVLAQLPRLAAANSQ